MFFYSDIKFADIGKSGSISGFLTHDSSRSDSRRRAENESLSVETGLVAWNAHRSAS